MSDAPDRAARPGSRPRVAFAAVALSTLVLGLGPAALGGYGRRRISDVPSPYFHPEQCGLPEKGWLCDPDGILSAEGRVKAMDVMVATREQTSVKCPSGYKGLQLAVAVIDSMHTADWVKGDKEATAKKFAKEIGDRWMVGDAGCSNGIVLFLSVGDRYAYIKTAARSRELLSDDLGAQVVDNMKPLLRSNQYDDAVLQALLQIHDALVGKAIPKPAGDSNLVTKIIFAAVLGTVFLPALVTAGCGLLTCLLMPFAWCLDRLTLKRALSSAERDLQRVQREVDRDEFDQTMCPVCLDALQDHATLDCGHRFHKSCIEPWIQSHGSCPLCRADVDTPLAPEDLERPQHYQRRLRFYLSRLKHRYPSLFEGHASSTAMYRRDHVSNAWMFYPLRHHLGGTPTQHSGAYARSLQARYQQATRFSQGWLNRGSGDSGRGSGGGDRIGGGFGGSGGGFGGGGGGGGGW